MFSPLIFLGMVIFSPVSMKDYIGTVVCRGFSMTLPATGCSQVCSHSSVVLPDIGINLGLLQVARGTLYVSHNEEVPSVIWQCPGRRSDAI